jgi:hypothetical protein
VKVRANVGPTIRYRRGDSPVACNEKKRSTCCRSPTTSCYVIQRCLDLFKYFSLELRDEGIPEFALSSVHSYFSILSSIDCTCEGLIFYMQPASLEERRVMADACVFMRSEGYSPPVIEAVYESTVWDGFPLKACSSASEEVVCASNVCDSSRTPSRSSERSCNLCLRAWTAGSTCFNIGLAGLVFATVRGSFNLGLFPA